MQLAIIFILSIIAMFSVCDGENTRTTDHCCPDSWKNMPPNSSTLQVKIDCSSLIIKYWPVNYGQPSQLNLTEANMFKVEKTNCKNNSFNDSCLLFQLKDHTHTGCIIKCRHEGCNCFLESDEAKSQFPLIFKILLGLQVLMAVIFLN